jgi:signal transduction histidine kinase
MSLRSFMPKNRENRKSPIDIIKRNIKIFNWIVLLIISLHLFLIIQFLYVILVDIFSASCLQKTIIKEIFSSQISTRSVITILSIVAGLVVICLYLVNATSKNSVTELEESLMLISRAKREWEASFDSISHIICLIDDQGYILRTNREIERWNLGQVVNVKGKSVHELLHPGCSDSACYFETFWQLAWGKLKYGQSTECEADDSIIGRCLHVQVQPISPKIYKRGEETASFAVVVVHDITEHKKAVEEIHRLNEELEQRVIERTKQLEETNKELEAFCYSVSHDLRGPLRAINGFSSMLLQDYADKLDNEGKRLLDIIRRNTKNMGELIDDLLALSRVGRKKIELKKIDMDKLAWAVFQDIKVTIPERKLEFHINLLPPAYGDSGMVRQVFVNLLTNAIKFTRLKDNSVIEVGGCVKDSENIYYVKDNGVGFEMQYADKLFDTFQRLHKEEEFEGTGIGLAIVQRIIHRHRGQVWAEGKVNEGATFYFTLPVHNENSGKKITGCFQEDKTFSELDTPCCSS